MPHARLIRFLATSSLACLVAFGAAACDVVVNTMGGGRATATDVWSRTYSLQDGAEVSIANTNGQIDVEGVDSPTLSVTAEIVARAGTDEAARELLKQVEIKEDAGASRVRLETRYPRRLGRASVQVKYTIRVPRGARIDVETVNGGIRLADVTGTVRAETTNGGVTGAGLGGAVTATSTNGGIDIQLAAVAPGGVALETTNGGIDLRLPGNAKGAISARTVNGGINVVDLDVDRSEATRRRLEATLNGGGPAIRLETVNGGIKVRRS